ncbi:MAG: nuclear transport factor 2 family protein [Actinomycetota bacterium]
MTTPDTPIRELLATYQRSLNTADAELAASCYTPDGVFMPTTLPTISGADLVAGYRQIFDTIRLDVTFTIDELVVTTDDAAYALTRSNGTQTVMATGDQTAESNREIFLFKRNDTDGWKIARYMFNKPEEQAPHLDPSIG